MPLELMCSQYPISRRILSNINSLYDVANFAKTSRTMYNCISNRTFKRRISVPNQVLEIKHHDNYLKAPFNWETVMMSHNHVNMNMNKMLQHIKEFGQERLENIYTIKVEYPSFYYTYSWYEINQFSEVSASFIDALFKICPNATTINFVCIHDFLGLVISKLTSPRIQIMNNVFFKSVTRYASEYPETCDDLIEKLTDLKEIHFYYTEFTFRLDEPVQKVLKAIYSQLARKSNNLVNFKGTVSDAYYYVFYDIFKLNFDIGANIGCVGSIQSTDQYYREYALNGNRFSINPVKHVTYIDVCIGSESIFVTFFKSLSFFEKLKTIKIYFCESLIGKIIVSMGRSEFVTRYIHPSFLARIPPIKELYLRFQHNHTIYPNQALFLKSLEIKNYISSNIFACLRETLRTLLIDGVPDLNYEMGTLITKRCPNLNDIHLLPYSTLDSRFIRDMKALKIVNLIGVYVLIVPENTEVVVVQPIVNIQSKPLADFSDEEIYNYFTLNFRKEFKVVLKNLYRGNVLFYALFKNVFLTKTYLDCVDIFSKSFC
uniref:F-box domain-containing protein n=1 Tax=Parastrongyloides trichosuri TaxID=131310 RepID=A0A0N4ZKW0_PARTI